jgi:DNA-binding response OmpR family regulator
VNPDPERSGGALPVAHPRLLLVEDEAHLAAGLKLNFELEGYAVEIASTGREAGRLLLHPRAYDIIVLDVMLPDVSGFTLCQKLRDAGNTTPVLMLTARDSVTDRVEGLNVGADDYLTKPFDLSELLARVRSLLRRTVWVREHETARPSNVLKFEDVEVDFDKHHVQVRGEELQLTKLELDLLRYFADNPGRVLSREELQHNVWKLRDYPNRRMVDNFILRLRRHFEPDPQNPIYFVSVRGAGYKFEPPG